MLKGVTPERVIYITWLGVALTVCWPPPANASRNQVIVFKILQICSVVNACLLFLPLLYSTYLHLDNIIVVSKNICLAIGVFQIMAQSLFCFGKYDRLQRVIGEMVTTVKEAQQYEREIFHKYIAKCYIFYGGSMAWIYVSAIGFSVGPAILPIPLPTDAEYPFRVNYTPIYIIVYLQQAIVSLQTASHVCISIFGAMLLWFTAARFECLIVELQKCSNVRMLIACVKKQMYLKRYAEEVVNGFRFIVLTVLGMSTLGLTLCGIIMVVNAPQIVKVQFILVCFTVLTEIYMYAWPADYMKDMSINVSQSVYNLTWYEQTLEMRKDLLYMLTYQEPVTLSITCIMPELTLRYYCSYLSNVFSAFTALRVVIGDST